MGVVVVEPGQRVVLVLDALAVELLNVFERLGVGEGEAHELPRAELVTGHVVHRHAFAEAAPTEVADGAIALGGFPGLEFLEVRRDLDAVPEFGLHRPAQGQLSLGGRRRSQNSGERLRAFTHARRVAPADDNDAAPVTEWVVHGADHVAFRAGVLEVNQAVVKVVEGVERLVGRPIPQHDHVAVERHCRFGGVVGHDRQLDPSSLLDGLRDGGSGGLVLTGGRYHEGGRRLAVCRQRNLQVQVFQLVVLRRHGWRRRRGRRRRGGHAADHLDLSHDDLGRRLRVGVQVDDRGRGAGRRRRSDGDFLECLNGVAPQAGLRELVGRQEAELQVGPGRRRALRSLHLHAGPVRLALLEREGLVHPDLRGGIAIGNEQRLPAVGTVHDLQRLVLPGAGILRPADRNTVVAYALCECWVLERNVEHFFSPSRQRDQYECGSDQCAVQVCQRLAHVRLPECMPRKEGV
ncbi:MAG: hypothetical protein COW34_07020 [Armatimonadetes bacterium CG17_big_fil_post_rev_8_21_14_2_50_66_6]|nr:MAG: hypothetical protein COW34_07020 [Armatimonadetes bacterium CG17_big_fil_post_rev_8_21_14_2_50_66_6]